MRSVRPLDIAPEHLRRVQAALDDIRAGKMIILVDDEDRENEGDLCLAADASRRRRSTSWPCMAAA